MRIYIRWNGTAVEVDHVRRQPDGDLYEDDDGNQYEVKDAV